MTKLTLRLNPTLKLARTLQDAAAKAVLAASKRGLVSLRFAFMRALLLAAAVLLAPSFANAQSFAGKPVTIIVGFPAGGSNDLVARIIAGPLGEALGTSVIVENKSGAAGTIAGAAVVRANPDGHTLLLSTLSPIIVSPQVMKNPSYITTRDLVGVNMVGTTAETIAIGASLPNIKTFQELLALSKTREVTLSSSGSGSFPHLAIELLIEASGGKFVHVPYKGATPAIADTIAGHVDGTLMDTPPIVGMVQDGRLRALAVTSDKPMDALPNVPTVDNFLKGYLALNWIGMFAPNKTPAATIKQLNDALTRTLARPDVIAQLNKIAVAPNMLASSDVFQSFVAQEYAKWGEVIKKAKIEQTD